MILAGADYLDAYLPVDVFARRRGFFHALAPDVKYP